MNTFEELNIHLESIYRASLIVNVGELYNGESDRDLSPLRPEELLKLEETRNLLDKAHEENELAYTYFFVSKLMDWEIISAIAVGIYEYSESLKDEINAFNKELTVIGESSVYAHVRLYIDRYIELQKEIIAYNYYASYFYDVLSDVQPPIKIEYNTYSRLNIRIRKMAKEQGLTVPNKASYKVNTKYPDPDTKEAVSMITGMLPFATIKTIKGGITIDERN